MLTHDELERRRLGIGSSDAALIMGNDEDWYNLWLDKAKGVPMKFPLSEWDVAIRHHCEPLILDWYEKQTGNKVAWRGLAVVSEEYPILRATLDGMDHKIPKVIDAKFLNIWTPDAKEWAVKKYTWQILHQMIVTNVPNGALHISLGSKEPFPVEIEYDDFTAGEYIDRCNLFWSYVKAGKEPPGAPKAVAPPKPIAELRTVSMEGNNAWAAAADDWLKHGEAAKLFDKSVKSLKDLVEKDVRLATGHGVEVSRDKRGLAIKKIGV